MENSEKPETRRFVTMTCEKKYKMLFHKDEDSITIYFLDGNMKTWKKGDTNYEDIVGIAEREEKTGKWIDVGEYRAENTTPEERIEKKITNEDMQDKKREDESGEYTKEEKEDRNGKTRYEIAVELLEKYDNNIEKVSELMRIKTGTVKRYMYKYQSKNRDKQENREEKK